MNLSVVACEGDIEEHFVRPQLPERLLQVGAVVVPFQTKLFFLLHCCLLAN